MPEPTKIENLEFLEAHRHFKKTKGVRAKKIFLDLLGRFALSGVVVAFGTPSLAKMLERFPKVLGGQWGVEFAIFMYRRYRLNKSDFSDKEKRMIRLISGIFFATLTVALGIAMFAFTSPVAGYLFLAATAIGALSYGMKWWGGINPLRQKGAAIKENVLTAGHRSIQLLAMVGLAVGVGLFMVAHLVNPFTMGLLIGAVALGGVARVAKHLIQRHLQKNAVENALIATANDPNHSDPYNRLEVDNGAIRTNVRNKNIHEVDANINGTRKRLYQLKGYNPALRGNTTDATTKKIRTLEKEKMTRHEVKLAVLEKRDARLGNLKSAVNTGVYVDKAQVATLHSDANLLRKAYSRDYHSILTYIKSKGDEASNHSNLYTDLGLADGSNWDMSQKAIKSQKPANDAENLDAKLAAYRILSNKNYRNLYHTFWAAKDGVNPRTAHQPGGRLGDGMGVENKKRALKAIRQDKTAMKLYDGLKLGNGRG